MFNIIHNYVYHTSAVVHNFMFYDSQFGRFSKPRVTTLSPSSSHQNVQQLYVRSVWIIIIMINIIILTVLSIHFVVSIKSDCKTRIKNSTNSGGDWRGTHAHSFPSRFSYTTQKKTRFLSIGLKTKKLFYWYFCTYFSFISILLKLIKKQTHNVVTAHLKPYGTPSYFVAIHKS